MTAEKLPVVAHQVLAFGRTQALVVREDVAAEMAGKYEAQGWDGVEVRRLTDADAASARIAELERENEALRKDAECWRFWIKRSAGFIRGYVSTDGDDDVPNYEGIRMGAAISAKEGGK